MMAELNTGWGETKRRLGSETRFREKNRKIETGSQKDEEKGRRKDTQREAQSER